MKEENKDTMKRMGVMKIIFDNLNEQLQLQFNELENIKSRIASAEARLRDPRNKHKI